MAATTAPATPITHAPAGADLDVATMLAQVPTWTWLRIGVAANGRGWVRARDYAMTMLPGRRSAKLIVKLDQGDTYSVEIGRIVKRVDYRVIVQAEGVYADMLGETIERLYAQAFER